MRKIIQTACVCCGQDIEGNKKDGWYDRGGNRECATYIARDGETVKPKGKHSPFLRPSMLLRPGVNIEVSRPKRKGIGYPYRPSYTWVQGWQVKDPITGQWCVEMSRASALRHAFELINGESK